MEEGEEEEGRGKRDGKGLLVGRRKEKRGSGREVGDKGGRRGGEVKGKGIGN